MHVHVSDPTNAGTTDARNCVVSPALFVQKNIVSFFDLKTLSQTGKTKKR